MITNEGLSKVLRRYMTEGANLDDYVISSSSSMYGQVLATAIEINGPETVLFALRWGHEVEFVINDIPVSRDDGLYITISKLIVLSEASPTKWTIIAKAYFLLLCLWDKAEFLPDSLNEVRHIINNNNAAKPSDKLNPPYSYEV